MIENVFFLWITAAVKNLPILQEVFGVHDGLAEAPPWKGVLTPPVYGVLGPKTKKAISMSVNKTILGILSNDVCVSL